MALLSPSEIAARAATVEAKLAHEAATAAPDPAAPTTDPTHSTGVKVATNVFGKIIPMAMELIRAATGDLPEKSGKTRAEIGVAAVLPVLMPYLRAIDIPKVPKWAESWICDFVEARILPHLITSAFTMLHKFGVG